jgi:Tfp pilus assembly protein PilN
MTHRRHLRDGLHAAFAGGVLARPLVFRRNVPLLTRGLRRVVASTALLDDAVPPAGRSQTVVDLHLPVDRLLLRRVRVPGGGRRHAKALAAMDLARRTPFAPGEVVWTLGGVDGSGEAATVEQWVARTEDIASIGKKLARAGFPVRRVWVEGHETEAPLTDLSTEVRRPGPWRLANGVLASGALAALVLAWLWPAIVAHRAEAAETARLAALRDEAVALRREIETLETRQRERAAFLAAVRDAPRLSERLRELTVALPDEVWLSAATMQEERLTLTGETGGSAAALVLALARDGRFGDPRLAGPVQRLQGGGERFEIRLEPGTER